MTTLLDLVATGSEVEIRGQKIPVFGLSGVDIAHLMMKFPAVNKLFSGVEPDSKELVSIGPAALSAVIAAGLGYPGDKKHEDAAAKLSAGEQLDIVLKIFTLTFPRGVGPFVEGLKQLEGAVAVDRVAPPRSSPDLPKSS